MDTNHPAGPFLLCIESPTGPEEHECNDWAAVLAIVGEDRYHAITAAVAYGPGGEEHYPEISC